jgi:hypothetical protein
MVWDVDEGFGIEMEGDGSGVDAETGMSECTFLDPSGRQLTETE